MTGVLKPIFDPKIQYARPRPPAVWLAPSSGALTDGRDTAAGTATSFIWADAAIGAYTQGYVGGGGFTCGGACTVTVTLPAHNDGDLLVVSVVAFGSSTPTGWTSHGNNWYSKVASSEPATVVWNWTVGRYAKWSAWSVEGSDNSLYDVGLNNNTSPPTYTFTGGGLVLLSSSNYGCAAARFDAPIGFDGNVNIGTAIGTYNFAAGNFSQVGGGDPTVNSGEIKVFNYGGSCGGGSYERTGIRICRLAQVV